MSWWVVREWIARGLALLPVVLPVVAAVVAAIGVRRWRRAPVAAVWLAPAAVGFVLAGLPPAAERVADARHDALTDAYHEALAARVAAEGVADPWALMLSDEAPAWFAARPELAADLERLFLQLQADHAAADRSGGPLLAPLRAVGWPGGWWAAGRGWPGPGPAALWAGFVLALLAAASRGRWGPAGLASSAPARDADPPDPAAAPDPA